MSGTVLEKMITFGQTMKDSGGGHYTKEMQGDCTLHEPYKIWKMDIYALALIENAFCFNETVFAFEITSAAYVLSKAKFLTSILMYLKK